MTDTSKLWKKVDTSSDGFYRLVQKVDFKSVLTKEEAVKDFSWWTNPDEIVDFKNLQTHILLNQTKDLEVGADIPVGCYSHKQSNYPSPELLEVINTRKDKFLNINKNLNSALEDMNTFLKNKPAYEELGMSYRRGYLFYGPPGNGKTSQIRNLTQNIFSNAITIWLNRLPSIEMCAALNASPYLKVFVMEEISSSNENSHYMKELLNFFDGETSVPNSIIIATTNYPEELEKNLIDRPSRFDFVIEIPNPTNSEAQEYFESFLGRPLGKDEIEFKNLSVAHIKEIVLQHRLFGKSLKETYNKMTLFKKKIKDVFPDKEKKAIGIGEDLNNEVTLFWD